MADFVAVIRRTVDGLSDNSPDMRSRVYEKARGAVRRQLENMKPRPSDEMIDRQMGKLEAAITEVEATHAPLPEESAPADAVPAGAMPAGALAAGGAATAVVAAAEVPAEDVPAQSAPFEEAPAEEAPVDDYRREEPPVEDAPAVEMPAAAAPAEATFEQPPVPYDVTHVAPEQPVEAAPGVQEPEHQPELEPEAVEEFDAKAGPDPYHEEPAAEPVEEPEPEPEPVTDDAAYAPEAEPYPEPEPIIKPQSDLEPQLYTEPEPVAAYWSEPEPAFTYAPQVSGDRDAPDAAYAAAEDDAPVRDPEPDVGDVQADGRDENDMLAFEEREPVEPARDETASYWAAEEPVEPYAPVPEPASIEPYFTETDEAPAKPAAYEPEPVAEPVFEPAGAPVVEPVEPERDASAMPAAGWDLPDWNDAPAEQPAEPVTAHIEPVWAESVESPAVEPVADHGWVDDEAERNSLRDVIEPAPVVLPAVSGGLTPEGEPSHSWALDETDPFQQDVRPDTTEPAVSDWSWPVDRTGETERTETSDEPPPPQNWDEIDNLLAAGGVAAAAQSRPSPEVPEAPIAVRRPASYRAEPRKSVFSIKRIATVLVLLLVFGGGGYAYWMNRDLVNGWVSETIASLNTAPPTTTNGGTSATGTGGGASGTAATGNATTDVASVEPSNKFTQRLQSDGSEIDEGAAQPPAGESAAQEGKSISAQTEASRPVDTADAAATTTPPAAGTPETTTAQTDAPVTPPVTDAAPATTPTTAPDEATTQMPAGAQKMFLYEERLGQTAPTAIEGGVAWSLKEEAPEAGQRPEPVIQAQITVPDRGLTALMTIKRNTDTSLPASHTIEFVFSLPETFEGGSIDSVQRVAMKRNEQDRGDPLIAVPAKITDDFHMIALNDFPEAVTTNLELLRSRSWIDIPLTYRNGRRALLTLEKGEAGNNAFTQALAAWSQARPAGQ